MGAVFRAVLPELPLALGYLAALTLAEVGAQWVAGLGPAVYGAVVVLFLAHAALCWDRRFGSLPLFLAGAAALRLAFLLEGPAGRPLFYVAGAVSLAAGGAAFRLGRGWGKDVLSAVRFGLTPLRNAPHLLETAVRRLRRVLRGDRGLLSARIVLPALALLGALLTGLLVVFPWGLQGGVPAQGPGRGDSAVLLDGPALPARVWAAGASASGAAGAAGSLVPAGGPDLSRPPRVAGKNGRATVAPSSYPDPVGGTEEMLREVAIWRPRQAEDGLVAAVTPAPREKVVLPDCPAAGYENLYSPGCCVWYAKEKRPDLPLFYGDYALALNWPSAAQACGFRVDGQPAAGAIIIFPPGANGAAWDSGHAAYVEEVGESYILISECNVTHDASYTEEPWWWESGYACAFRRISFDLLDPRVRYIHEGPVAGEAARLPE